MNNAIIRITNNIITHQMQRKMTYTNTHKENSGTQKGKESFQLQSVSLEHPLPATCL